MLRSLSARSREREEHTHIVERIPRVRYGQFLREFVWNQGEHITEIGPTGYGKTTLAEDILTRRQYVLAFGTKKEDDTLDKLITERGYKRIESIAEINLLEQKKYVLWPRLDNVKTADEIITIQKERFREALFGGFRQGGWTIYLDELRYITARLGLASEYELLLEQGRSIRVSVIAAYQRPRNIPLLAYDQPEHLFFFKETDRENIARMAEVVSWLDRRLMIETISHLQKYDFLYLNKSRERALISRVEKR